MNCYRALCACLLLLGVNQLANATGGAVNLTLDQLFQEYEIQTVFIGEIRGLERSNVSGFEPRDGGNADEVQFHQYSYFQIKFRVAPLEALLGQIEIGKPINLIFKEQDFSGVVTLKKDGTVVDTGPTALGFISAGSGNERNNQFSQPGQKAVFIIGKGKGEKDVRLLRVEHPDQAIVQKLEVWL